MSNQTEMSGRKMLYTEYNLYECDKKKKEEELVLLKEKYDALLKELEIEYKKIISIDDDSFKKYYCLVNEKDLLGRKIEEYTNFIKDTHYYIKNGNVLNTYFSNMYTSKPNLNKVDLLNQYLLNNDKHYIGTTEQDKTDIFCTKCNVERIINGKNSLYICPECGEEVYSINVSFLQSYKDPPQEHIHFSYERVKHCKDHIARIQAKENTKIPQIICDIILYEFAKERKTNLAELNVTLVQKYLKKYKAYKFNKYCNNARQIINKLNGIKQINIPKEIEDDLLNMFIQIDSIFDKICPKDRSNLITYE